MESNFTHRCPLSTCPTLNMPSQICARGLKRLPIKVAKDVAVKYRRDVVLIIALDEAAVTHVVTFGRNLVFSDGAAEAGNRIKEHFLKWPLKECAAESAKVKALRRRVRLLKAQVHRLLKTQTELVRAKLLEGGK